MTVLVFGQTGQVARELARLGGVTCLSRAEADLSNPEACAKIIAATDATAVINAAAYTAVDGAETDEATAHVVNAMAPGAMARAAAARDLPFVHISTDYVFDGSGDTPWGTDAPTAPLNAYGRSKLAGEQAVRAAGGPHAILRTSWVFSAHGKNFVKTVLRLAEGGGPLMMVNDQTGGPTWAGDIARACLALVRALHNGQPSGTWHLSGGPDVTWAAFARAILSEAGHDEAGRDVAVKPIPSTAFATPAKRPCNSRLDCASLWADLGIARPDWRVGLRATLQELERTEA